MIPILFNANETEYKTRGIGALADAISCTVTEERNSVYELELTYPKDGLHFSDILLDRIIYAIPSPFRSPQPFRIYKISTPMRGIVTINAQHISYDLSGITVMPFVGNSVSDVFSKIKQNSVNENRFSFEGSSTLSTECSYTTPNPARQILGGMNGSILDMFGGEYEFDGYTVKWSVERGRNSGVTIRYGKNLLDISHDVDISGVIDGVVPYWADTDGNDAVIGSVVYMDGDLSSGKIIPLDLSQDYEEPPTKEALEIRAKTFINANYSTSPKLNCDISIALISQSEEYKEFKMLEQCDICDTITVVYPELNVNSTAKIVKISTDVLRERYNSISIGTVRANIAQTIAAQEKQAESFPTRKDVGSLIQKGLDAITGADGGTVRLLDTNGDGEPDTLYIADNSDPTKARKIWRWNYLGWAATNDGYNGQFTLGATLEDGLLADFVTAAKLTAGTITSADDGKTFFLDLDAGVLNMNANALTIKGSTVEELSKGEIANESQQSVFDKLTNNGNAKGIFLQNGQLYINGTYISVDDLQAIGATIGSFKINANDIVSEVKATDGNTYTVKISNPDNESAEANFLSAAKGSSQTFYVHRDGKLYAANAEISGKIDASSGSFDNVTISGSRFTGGSISSGGTFTGRHSSGAIASCSLEGTQLKTTDSGSAYIATYGSNAINVHGSGGVYMNDGSHYIYIRSAEYPITMVGKVRAVNGIETQSVSNPVQTMSFNTRLLTTTQNAAATVSDYGEGVIAEDGTCFVYIDPVLAETITDKNAPVVFLTAYGEGEVYVDTVGFEWFVVKGTPGLMFAWEARYRQTSTERLEDAAVAVDLSDDKDYNYEAISVIKAEDDAAIDDAFNYFADFEENTANIEEMAYNYLDEYERGLFA